MWARLYVLLRINFNVTTLIINPSQCIIDTSIILSSTGEHSLRKYFIDNIRWIAVMLLFPYHTFMVYNTFGESFYVKGADITLTTGFLVATWPWFMPLLFTIAGVSSAYALQKRSSGQYVKERVSKLLIPLITGILLVIPAQTYFAERFHNGYTGGYFEQYVLFFTKPTDLTGYAGGFTPGHLWFILYLFVISIIALPIMNVYQKSGKKLTIQNMPMPVLLILFILPLLGALILDIGGKSLGEYFAYFMLGYFVVSNDTILDKVGRYRFPLLIVSILNMAIMLLWWRGALSFIPDIAHGIFSRFYAWVMILALLGMGKHYLNFRNKVTDYFSASSFPAYVFHQTWIVIVGYYVVSYVNNVPTQIILIMLGSFMLTYATHEVCKRIPVTRFLFGIKNRL